MISDLDIWRAAHMLVKQHGVDAETVAARRTDELMEREDWDGHAVWLRIAGAVIELQAPPTGPAH